MNSAVCCSASSHKAALWIQTDVNAPLSFMRFKAFSLFELNLSRQTFGHAHFHNITILFLLLSLKIGKYKKI